MPKPPATTTRVVIEAVSPTVDAGRYPVKRVVGEPVAVEADVFADGHDVVRAVLRYRAPRGRTWGEVAMEPAGNDRWWGAFTPDALGIWEFRIEGWVDHFLTWLQGLDKKVGAGVDVGADLLIGAGMVHNAAARGRGRPARSLKRLAGSLGNDRLGMEERLATAFSPDLEHLMRDHPDRSRSTLTEDSYPVMVDRERARFSTWYEAFPRSWSPVPGRHGTLADLAARLDYVADMGFDVLYLPPIHPIGSTFRKGPNNTFSASPDDVGVPWAIGSELGGHTAIHPGLGSIEDFHLLRDQALARGMEIALDVAFQCSPDHPWVTEHPEWFRHRPDGTIQYAENPPKKYQDIYPLDFETSDPAGLWSALKGVFDFWIGHGVRIFRVDNPHTKAFPFWEWVIGEIRSRHPDVLLLSEAFTRPKVMVRLAKLGFTQSYTYFAWRKTGWELKEYTGDLARVAGFFRPNFWPNTPDILTEQLQTGGRPMFISRYVLAATLSSNCGIYGPAYELMEHTPIAEGSEEYRDSEKYQIRVWDFTRPDSLAPIIAKVNAARHAHRALQRNEGLVFHPTDNEMLLAYSKRWVNDAVLVVVSLDPIHPQAGWVDLDLDGLDLDPDQPFRVHDLLTDQGYDWRGGRNFVRLDPAEMPAHLFAVSARPAPVARGA